MRKSAAQLQKERDLESVWVAQARWVDGSWGPFPQMGCSTSKRQAMALAKDYIYSQSISWAMGTRTGFGFSDRIRFRKYLLESVKP